MSSEGSVVSSKWRAASETDGWSIEEIVALLEIGDKVRWEGRKTPCEVVERREYREGRGSGGDRLTEWILEGRQGGQMRLSNWVHWGDSDEYGPENPKGVYPQIRRIGTDKSNGELVAHLGYDTPFWLVADHRWSMNYLDRQTIDDPEDITRIKFEKPLDDASRFADVVDWEFGQPIAKPIRMLTREERRNRGDRGLATQRYEYGTEQAIPCEQVLAVKRGDDDE